MSLTPLIQNATQTLVDHLEELTALDQAIGDGDHGLNMKRGAQAIQAKLADMEGNETCVFTPEDRSDLADHCIAVLDEVRPSRAVHEPFTSRS